MACYILSVKDRHNGNLMIDNKGNLVHIDFGFLLGTSPGGNMGFETAAFKLSEEMYRLLGGSMEATPFREFLDLTVEAFLCIRKYWSEICSLVNCMSDSGLPCFLPSTLSNLKGRFTPEQSESQAALNMVARVTKGERVDRSRKTRARSGPPSSTTASRCCRTAFTPTRGELFVRTTSEWESAPFERE